MAPIPITIVTGFLGSGKTTLILKLLPQLPAGYRVALLKNEFGDVAVDSRLASTAAVSGVRELLNGCICCNLVGQLGDALAELSSSLPLPPSSSSPGNDTTPVNGNANGDSDPTTTTTTRPPPPDRIIIETSGSAFPATLALEVNRLAAETAAEAGGPRYALDGVVSVIDVENWAGYDDTSYTARAQARYTDLVVLNKWEEAGERRLEECEDRVLDLEIDVARVRSDRGFVPYHVLVGLDGRLARAAAEDAAADLKAAGTNGAEGGAGHGHDHQSEVNVLSVVLPGKPDVGRGLDVNALDTFLKSAPKEDIYRIKAVFWASDAPLQSDGRAAEHDGPQQYVLNWAFGRWTLTSFSKDVPSNALEMTIVTARDEATKWQKKIEASKPFKMSDGEAAELKVKRLA